MELLDLQPPDYGVRSTGIYIIDDDGLRVFAGPFESKATAIAWIIQRQETPFGARVGDLLNKRG